MAHSDVGSLGKAMFVSRHGANPLNINAQVSNVISRRLTPSHAQQQRAHARAAHECPEMSFEELCERIDAHFRRDRSASSELSSEATSGSGSDSGGHDSRSTRRRKKRTRSNSQGAIDCMEPMPREVFLRYVASPGRAASKGAFSKSSFLGLDPMALYSVSASASATNSGTNTPRMEHARTPSISSSPAHSPSLQPFDTSMVQPGTAGSSGTSPPSMQRDSVSVDPFVLDSGRESPASSISAPHAPLTYPSLQHGPGFGVGTALQLLSSSLSALGGHAYPSTTAGSATTTTQAGSAGQAGAGGAPYVLRQTTHDVVCVPAAPLSLPLPFLSASAMEAMAQAEAEGGGFSVVRVRARARQALLRRSASARNVPSRARTDNDNDHDVDNDNVTTATTTLPVARLARQYLRRFCQNCATGTLPALHRFPQALDTPTPPTPGTGAAPPSPALGSPRTAIAIAIAIAVVAGPPHLAPLSQQATNATSTTAARKQATQAEPPKPQLRTHTLKRRLSDSLVLAMRDIVQLRLQTLLLARQDHHTHTAAAADSEDRGGAYGEGMALPKAAAASSSISSIGIGIGVGSISSVAPRGGVLQSTPPAPLTDSSILHPSRVPRVFNQLQPGETSSPPLKASALSVGLQQAGSSVRATSTFTSTSNTRLAEPMPGVLRPATAPLLPPFPSVTATSPTSPQSATTPSLRSQHPPLPPLPTPSPPVYIYGPSPPPLPPYPLSSPSAFNPPAPLPPSSSSSSGSSASSLSFSALMAALDRHARAPPPLPPFPLTPADSPTLTPTPSPLPYGYGNGNSHGGFGSSLSTLPLPPLPSPVPSPLSALPLPLPQVPLSAARAPARSAFFPSSSKTAPVAIIGGLLSSGTHKVARTLSWEAPPMADPAGGPGPRQQQQRSSIMSTPLSAFDPSPSGGAGHQRGGSLVQSDDASSRGSLASVVSDPRLGSFSAMSISSGFSVVSPVSAALTRTHSDTVVLRASHSPLTIRIPVDSSKYSQFAPIITVHDSRSASPARMPIHDLMHALPATDSTDPSLPRDGSFSRNSLSRNSGAVSAPDSPRSFSVSFGVPRQSSWMHPTRRRSLPAGFTFPLRRTASFDSRRASVASSARVSRRVSEAWCGGGEGTVVGGAGGGALQGSTSTTDGSVGSQRSSADETQLAVVFADHEQHEHEHERDSKDPEEEPDELGGGYTFNIEAPSTRPAFGSILNRQESRGGKPFPMPHKSHSRSKPGVVGSVPPVMKWQSALSWEESLDPRLSATTSHTGEDKQAGLVRLLRRVSLSSKSGLATEERAALLKTLLLSGAQQREDRAERLLDLLGSAGPARRKRAPKSRGLLSRMRVKHNRKVVDLNAVPGQEQPHLKYMYSRIPVTSQDPMVPASLLATSTRRHVSHMNLRRFTPIRLLGRGANGVVLLVQRGRDQKLFAAKIIPVHRPPPASSSDESPSLAGVLSPTSPDTPFAAWVPPTTTTTDTTTETTATLTGVLSDPGGLSRMGSGDNGALADNEADDPTSPGAGSRRGSLKKQQQQRRLSSVVGAGAGSAAHQHHFTTTESSRMPMMGAGADEKDPWEADSSGSEPPSPKDADGASMAALRVATPAQSSAISDAEEEFSPQSEPVAHSSKSAVFPATPTRRAMPLRQASQTPKHSAGSGPRVQRSSSSSASAAASGSRHARSLSHSEAGIIGPAALTSPTAASSAFLFPATVASTTSEDPTSAVPSSGPSTSPSSISASATSPPASTSAAPGSSSSASPPTSLSPPLFSPASSLGSNASTASASPLMRASPPSQTHPSAHLSTPSSTPPSSAPSSAGATPVPIASLATPSPPSSVGSSPGSAGGGGGGVMGHLRKIFRRRTTSASATPIPASPALANAALRPPSASVSMATTPSPPLTPLPQSPLLQPQQQQQQQQLQAPSQLGLLQPASPIDEVHKTPRRSFLRLGGKSRTREGSVHLGDELQTPKTPASPSPTASPQPSSRGSGSGSGSTGLLALFRRTTPRRTVSLETVPSSVGAATGHAQPSAHLMASLDRVRSADPVIYSAGRAAAAASAKLAKKPSLSSHATRAVNREPGHSHQLLASEVYTAAAYSEILITKLASDLPAHFVHFEEVFKVHSIKEWIRLLDDREKAKFKENMRNIWKQEDKKGKRFDYQIVITEFCESTLDRWLEQFRKRKHIARHQQETLQSENALSPPTPVEDKLRSKASPRVSLMLTSSPAVSAMPAAAVVADNDARRPKVELKHMRYLLFGITYSLLASKLLIGLEWNDLAFRNICLKLVPSPKAVYRYRVRDNRGKQPYSCVWAVPREDLLQIDGQSYVVKLVDFGVSEAVGGSAYQRNPAWKYRKMTDQRIFKIVHSPEDKDMVDLCGTIAGTLREEYVKALPAALLPNNGNVLKGEPAVAALKKFLEQHAFFQAYKKLGASSLKTKRSSMTAGGGAGAGAGAASQSPSTDSADSALFDYDVNCDTLTFHRQPSHRQTRAEQRRASVTAHRHGTLAVPLPGGGSSSPSVWHAHGTASSPAAAAAMPFRDTTTSTTPTTTSTNTYVAR